jgi:hypothetical protein
MTPEAYATSICSKRSSAVNVPFVEVTLDGWSPRVAQCHENADAWVRANPGSSVVRGWVTYASFGDAGFGLTAHSVVRGADGLLLDITPLCDESLRQGMRFIEHDGDAASYDELKKFSIKIHCLSCGGSAPTDEPSQIEDDEIGEEE